MVQLDLLKYELLVLRNLQTEKFEVKVEVLDWVSSWLVLFKVQSLHVGVS